MRAATYGRIGGCLADESKPTAFSLYFHYNRFDYFDTCPRLRPSVRPSVRVSVCLLLVITQQYSKDTKFNSRFDPPIDHPLDWVVTRPRPLHGFAVTTLCSSEIFVQVTKPKKARKIAVY